MKIQMQLLSDTIFGNGMSIPGGEDISTLKDDQGFPYYKGSSLKGIFREEAQNLCLAKGMEESAVKPLISELLGEGGDDLPSDEKLAFSDMRIPDPVKTEICREIGDSPDKVFRALTHVRTFTALDENGIVKEGSLRSACCANKGCWYEGEIICPKDKEDFVKEVLACIKWIGTMRNRGFGKVCFSWEED